MNARALTDDKPARARAGGPEPLLDAALRVIEREGIDALTVRAVAHEAKVSPGTVSYHFDSTDELLERALEHGAGQIAKMLEQLAGSLMESDWDAAQWPAIFAAALATSLDAHRPQHLACIELHMAAARRPALRPAAERIQLAYARVALTVVRAMGIPDGAQVVIGLVAMVTGLMLKELTTPAPGAEQRLRGAFEAAAAAFMPRGGASAAKLTRAGRNAHAASRPRRD